MSSNLTVCSCEQDFDEHIIQIAIASLLIENSRGDFKARIYSHEFVADKTARISLS